MFLVQLDVGGTLYTVSSVTLLKYPESQLSKLAEEWHNDTSSDFAPNPIFIDRDGERFKYVLDGYRDGCIILPRTVSIGSLENELRYFGLSKIPIRQERPTFDECLSGSKEGLLELTVKLHETYSDQKKEFRMALQCASSLGTMQEEVKNSSENFALWAVREAIQQYITNNDCDYEAFLHEYLKVYPSNYSRPDLSYALGAAYKILRGHGLGSINVICTRRYHALAFSFLTQECKIVGRRNSF